MGSVESMQLDYTHTYAATPEKVVALMRTKEFIDDVAQHAGAVSHSVEIGDQSTKLTMKLPVPASLTKFVGATLTLAQTFRFDSPAADGSVHGTVAVDVTGMPVDVAADLLLTPTGESSNAHYTGTLAVKIPIVGRKVESQVEPFIRDAFAGLQRRAAVWLAR